MWHAFYIYICLAHARVCLSTPSEEPVSCHGPSWPVQGASSATGSQQSVDPSVFESQVAEWHSVLAMAPPSLLLLLLAAAALAFSLSILLLTLLNRV